MDIRQYPRYEELAAFPSATELKNYNVAVPLFWPSSPEEYASGFRSSIWTTVRYRVVYLDPVVKTADDGKTKSGAHFYWMSGAKRYEYNRRALQALTFCMALNKVPEHTFAVPTLDDEGSMVSIIAKETCRLLCPDGEWKVLSEEKNWVRNVEMVTPYGEEKAIQMQIQEVQHAHAKTASKAHNRILRDVCSGLTRDGALLNSEQYRARPHLVSYVRLDPDYSNPFVRSELRRRAAGCNDQLYGESRKTSRPTTHFAPKPQHTKPDPAPVPPAAPKPETQTKPAATPTPEQMEKTRNKAIAELQDKALKWNRDAFVSLTAADPKRAREIMLAENLPDGKPGLRGQAKLSEDRFWTFWARKGKTISSLADLSNDDLFFTFDEIYKVYKKVLDHAKTGGSK